MNTTARRILCSYPIRVLGVAVLVVAGLTLAARLDLVADEARPSSAVEAVERVDAVLLVGRDIAPGTYRTAGAPGGGYCFWSRLSSASGQGSDIIASDGSYGGQLIVTIEPTDVLFKTRGCAPFERIG